LIRLPDPPDDDLDVTADALANRLNREVKPSALAA
jgi:hypothetical protein